MYMKINITCHLKFSRKPDLLLCRQTASSSGDNKNYKTSFQNGKDASRKEVSNETMLVKFSFSVITV